MIDSQRWCATCHEWGDHHTDRCPSTYDASPEAAMPEISERARAQAAAKASSAASAKYPKGCRKCGAKKGQPCRSKLTRRVTDTHRVRIEDSYPS